MGFNHEGEAYFGHMHTDQSLSFGMESRRLNQKSASFSFDAAGLEGTLSLVWVSYWVLLE